jgi:hypothetical protein
MGTALNDDRVLRLTGSLPLVQKSLAGDVMLSLSLWVLGVGVLWPPGGGNRLGLGRAGLDHAPDGPDKAG